MRLHRSVRLALVMCTLALLRPSLAHAQGGTAERDTEAEAVKMTMVEMWAAIEAGDLEKYASFVHSDFTQFGETDAYLSEGKALEMRSMTEYLQRAKGVRTEMHNAKVTVRGPVAWVTYYWTDGGTVDGKRTASRGKSTRIFVKEHGRWLCIHGHYTLAP